MCCIHLLNSQHGADKLTKLKFSSERGAGLNNYQRTQTCILASWRFNSLCSQELWEIPIKNDSATVFTREFIKPLISSRLIPAHEGIPVTPALVVSFHPDLDSFFICFDYILSGCIAMKFTSIITMRGPLLILPGKDTRCAARNFTQHVIIDTFRIYFIKKID